MPLAGLSNLRARSCAIASERRSVSEWTFLTNHALVLSFLAKHPRITALDLAEAIGIRERAVRRIISELEFAGYIKKKRDGRRNTYTIDLDMPLRHQTHQHVAIGNFLEALAWERVAGNGALAEPGGRLSGTRRPRK